MLICGYPILLTYIIRSFFYVLALIISLIEHFASILPLLRTLVSASFSLTTAVFIFFPSITLRVTVYDSLVLDSCYSIVELE